MDQKLQYLIIHCVASFAAKACPSFDVPLWLKEIGVPEKNWCKEPLQYKFQ